MNRRNRILEHNKQLQSKDKDIRLKAWKTLEASELGEKYRVTPRRRGTNDHRIIVR